MTVRTGNTGSVLPFLAAAGRWRADGQRGPPSSAQRTAVFCQSAADVQPHRSIELAIEPARLSFSLCPRACRVALFCGQRHRAAAYILLNLDAAPPVTFATRRAASSVLSSSSCFWRTSASATSTRAPSASWLPAAASRAGQATSGETSPRQVRRHAVALQGKEQGAVAHVEAGLVFGSAQHGAIPPKIVPTLLDPTA